VDCPDDFNGCRIAESLAEHCTGILDFGILRWGQLTGSVRITSC
jgi:hypothetical protein